MAPSSSLADAIANVKNYYAARIAALYGTLPAAELSAAIQAIKDEQEQAIRIIIEEWSAHLQNRKPQPEKNPERASDPRPLLRLPGMRKS